jgi:predicted RNA-binding Zn ribbon-like protein
MISCAFRARRRRKDSWTSLWARRASDQSIALSSHGRDYARLVTLPTWVPDGHKQAPMPLLLVQSFVNTLDLDEGTDLLADAETAGAWLHAAGLLGPDVRVTPADLRLAGDVREGIRAMLASNSSGAPAAAAHDLSRAGDVSPPGGPPAAGSSAPDSEPDAGQFSGLRELTAMDRLRLDVGPAGRVQLVPEPTGRLAAGLLSLLVTVRDAQRDGIWERLKICGNPGCQWAFFDRSHSRQGSWCDMSSCGNLIKNRNLRARRRTR